MSDNPTKQPLLTTQIHRNDFIIGLIIFFIAITVRLYYQGHSAVQYPLRADAGQYFNGALNMVMHGTFSEAPLRLDAAPTPNTSRVPGYSIFLIPFFYTSGDKLSLFLAQVTSTQAFLGALTAMLTFYLARACLPLAWAATAGVLTALSPHLISMEKYILSENTFIFFVMLGVLTLLRSWIDQKAWLAPLSGIFFGLALMTRPVALLLGPFAALVYFLDPRQWKPGPKGLAFKSIFLFLCGLACVMAPFILRNSLSSESAGQVSDVQKIGNTLGNVILGSYPNLIHKEPGKERFQEGFPYRDDPEYEKMNADSQYFLAIIKERIKERPLAYLKWYLGGKILYSWRWGIAGGAGDVYVYPMARYGFHSDPWLMPIHTLMKALHQPLVILALLLPIIFLLLKKRITNVPGSIALVLPFLVIVYHAILLTALFPLPRYTIPLRPYGYLLAVSSIYYLTLFIKSFISNPNNKGVEV